MKLRKVREMHKDECSNNFVNCRIYGYIPFFRCACIVLSDSRYREFVTGSNTAMNVHIFLDRMPSVSRQSSLMLTHNLKFSPL